MRFAAIVFVFLLPALQRPLYSGNPNQIVGKWLASEKNRLVEVSKINDESRATILWFDDSDDKSKPMSIRMDEHNPDPAVGKRKIPGMDVLRGLVYNQSKNRWQMEKDMTPVQAESGILLYG